MTVTARQATTRTLVALAAAALALAPVALGATAASAAPARITITSSQCPTDMQQGENDGCVTDLQYRLNDNGATLTVDGDFGPGTLSAVKSYQSSHGLTSDGIVGPATKASLVPDQSSDAVHQRIVAYAKAIQNGDAERGWSGGKIQYVWGGGHKGSASGPSTGTCVGDPDSISCTQPDAVGLDCSGFVRWVYDLSYGSDVLSSGATGSQIQETRKVSTPEPGDLVFFGSSTSSTHHVGIYIGNDRMINSYETGTVVQTNSISAQGDSLGFYRYGG